MPVTLRELWKSRNPNYGPNGGGETRSFIAIGSTDQVEVFNAVVAGTELVWDGFIRGQISLEPLGGPNWEATVEYTTFGLGGGETPVGVTPVAPTAPGGNGGSPGGPGDSEPLGPGYSIDITAENEHITYGTRPMRGIGRIAGENEPFGLEAAIGGGGVVDPDTISVDDDQLGMTVFITGGLGWKKGPYRIIAVDEGGGTWTLDQQPAPPGSTGGVCHLPEAGPDFKGAINVTKDGVEGADIFKPRFDWTRSVARAVVTRAYIKTLRSLVGKMNDAPFYGAEPGEVLYLGASGSYTTDGQWSITHKFSEIANRSNIVIVPGSDPDGGLIVPYKRGWDLLWVEYKDSQPGGPDTPIYKVPVSAHVTPVVEEGDFSLIDIGY